MDKYETYSFWIGLWKASKNIAIIWGIPALVFLIQNVNEWTPEEHKGAVKLVIGLISYLIKNYVENK